MKYSIRGKINKRVEEEVISIINKYTIWRLTIGKETSIIFNNQENLVFEVWLNNEEDKNELFEELKHIVNLYGDLINWHKCTHDEDVNTPCVISEEYRR